MSEAEKDAAHEHELRPVPDPALQERFRAALPNATRWLPASRPQSPADALRDLAIEASDLTTSADWDRYGARGPVAELETRVAEILGKPAAAMFVSGIMAQQSVLRVWCGRQGSTRIALPALSHLLHHELDGPAQLNGFRYDHLTTGAQVPLACDLAAIPGRLGAALLELPLRDAGYLVPTWDELSEFSVAARRRGVPLHVDGARLWEAQPYLGRGLDEIAAVADTVYVSFYKGLGGLAGAVVAGPEDIVAEARRWRTRHGGTLFTMMPYAVSALRGLRTLLPRMPDFYQRAVALADAFERRGVRVFPNPPQCNAFRVYFDRPQETLNERIMRSLEADKVVLLHPVSAGEMPGTSWTEFAVGAATMEWDVEEAADALSTLLT